MPETMTMTNRELRDAIERTPRGSPDWYALISVACRRVAYWRQGAYPLSWLPRGVSWPADYSTGPSTW
jgi:hypothetical protein